MTQLLNAPARRPSGDCVSFKRTQKWKVNNVMKAQPFKEFAVISFSLLFERQRISA